MRFYSIVGILSDYLLPLPRNKHTLTMKNAGLLALLAFCAMFVSCKQEVRLYANYKEVPVIYGLLDARADTNYIKVSRSFYAQDEDAWQIAMNPDSTNYPGRLDVRLTEYCNDDSVRQIVLDTITLHNKQSGVFSAPDQKLYYTAEPLAKNTKNDRYSYKLTVTLPDKTTIVTSTDIVGSNGFRVKSLGINFSEAYFELHRPFYFYPAINAKRYDVSLSFSFLEQRTPDSDSVKRTVSWNVGTWDEFYLYNHMDNGAYAFTYRPGTFYEELREFLGADTVVPGLTRLVGDYPIELTIAAAGDELAQYIYYGSLAGNGSTNGSGDFSLINGAEGVFSSRMYLRGKLRLGGETIPELVSKKWGFKFMGGEFSDSSFPQ